MKHRLVKAAIMPAHLFIVVGLAACSTLHPASRQAAAAASAVGPGDSATFAEAALVRVRNLEPLDAKTGYFVFNDECLALDGGRITAVAVHGGRVLARYEPPKQKFYGSCPAGTLFFVSAGDFAGMTARYHLNKAELDAERQLVERLLAAPAPVH